MRAAELDHEVGDGSVHMKPVVKALVHEVDEIRSSDWHLLGVNLSLLATRAKEEGDKESDK